jgi:mannose-6-phosphate isomerase-like protein (cupin superfamily)
MAETTDVAFTTINTNTSERFQSLRRELGVEGFGINAITLAPRQRGRIHDHGEQEEVFLVLDGELTIAIEGEEQKVGRNGLVRVPSGVRRQLINRGPATLLMVALGAAGEHVGRDASAWESWDEDRDAGRSPQEVPLPADLPV